MIETLQIAEKNVSEVFEQSIICLFELNDSGTILYCRSNLDQQCKKTLLETTIGRNFFDEAAPFDNTAELRRKFNHFIKCGKPTAKFDFGCRIKNRIFPVKIMLTRIGEISDDSREKAVIVDIRKPDYLASLKYDVKYIK